MCFKDWYSKPRGSEAGILREEDDVAEWAVHDHADTYNHLNTNRFKIKEDRL